ncbi:MAG: galactitol-1-phosphate 5-dehydrogenase [Lachnospiraceae bacterium]|nr:galactitol-1-phosphate 5-dehydrogenase [Lachnospiraceae bacterium]
MNAYVLHDIGDFRYEEIENPIPGEGEVLVRVKNAGICGSDIPRVYKTGMYSYPLSPGHEFAGVVEGTGTEQAAGSSQGSEWIGKRVGVFPLIPCGSCPMCQKRKYELCRKYNYLGSRTNGAFAEYVKVPVANLIELPESVSFEVAAMLEPMAVAVHAMRQSMPQKTDTVVVHGLGTIGYFLTMFLKSEGISNVLVIGNKEFQSQQAVALGIKDIDYCDAKLHDVGTWIQERTNGVGADVYFECVGKNETISQAILSTRPAGIVQLIGNPASDMQFDKNTYWKILRNQLTIRGSWNSSFLGEEGDDWHYVLQRVAKGLVSPEHIITHRFVLRDLEQGLQIMRDKTEEYGKIMITL